MPRTFGQLATMVRRRLGWPSTDSFVSDAELIDMLLESRNELFDFMVSIHQGSYRLTSTTIATVADQSSYYIQFKPDLTLGDLVGNPVARVVRVAAQFDDISVPMRRWNPETGINRTDSVQWQAGTDLQYRFSTGFQFGEMLDRILHVYPTPSNVATIEIWYNVGPVGTTSVSTTGLINDLENDEYLVLDGMIKCLQMEETDTSAVERQKERLIARLQNEASPIDEGQPQTIQDTRGYWNDTPDRRWP